MTHTKLCDLVHLPPNEAKLLPRGWQILGTVILVSIPDALRNHANAIGDALLAMYPRCSTVLWNRGVAGRFREPICEVIDLFHRDEMTTFVVSNGTQPEMIAKIAPTQLYLSLNAPDEDTYLKVCNPCGNFWAEIQESLRVLGRSKTRTRTAVRITLIKGVNMFDPEGYARLLRTCEPDYIEVKAYMHVGFSQKRLDRAAMPDHEEVRLFASEIGDAVGYRIADDSRISRVVLLSRDGGVEQIQGRG